MPELLWLRNRAGLLPISTLAKHWRTAETRPGLGHLPSFLSGVFCGDGKRRLVKEQDRGSMGVACHAGDSEAPSEGLDDFAEVPTVCEFFEAVFLIAVKETECLGPRQKGRKQAWASRPPLASPMPPTEQCGAPLRASIGQLWQCCLAQVGPVLERHPSPEKIVHLVEHVAESRTSPRVLVDNEAGSSAMKQVVHTILVNCPHVSLVPEASAGSIIRWVLETIPEAAPELLDRWLGASGGVESFWVGPTADELSPLLASLLRCVCAMEVRRSLGE